MTREMSVASRILRFLIKITVFLSIKPYNFPVSILQKCHDEFWSLAPPDIHTVIYREISSVGAEWQRQGIASKMLERGLQEAKNNGINGIVSATSSHANQVLLAKNGFECLKEFSYSSVVEPGDGSKGMRINFLRIKK
uniref:N-acetyltransferase domain-containing protein n=1 Tax=Caenorhabditis tropicalis TaxID=1561998 RepID=A0A1I7UJD6_9PELO